MPTACYDSERVPALHRITCPERAGHRLKTHEIPRGRAERQYSTVNHSARKRDGAIGRSEHCVALAGVQVEATMPSLVGAVSQVEYALNDGSREWCDPAIAGRQTQDDGCDHRCKCAHPASLAWACGRCRRWRASVEMGSSFPVCGGRVVR